MAWEHGALCRGIKLWQAGVEGRAEEVLKTGAHVKDSSLAGGFQAQLYILSPVLKKLQDAGPGEGDCDRIEKEKSRKHLPGWKQLLFQEYLAVQLGNTSLQWIFFFFCAPHPMCFSG